MNVAIIPARGGSRRIPKKNIRVFAGRPMIEYSIEAALKSDIFDLVIVSTDSEEIAETALQAGAKVPFMRPAELAENYVSVVDVLHHTLTCLLRQGEVPELACCLTATAPFLKPEFIAEGYRLIKENDSDCVVSVTRFPFPIFRAFQKLESGRMSLIWPEHEFSHSDQLPEAYHDAAQFYWLNVPKFLTNKMLLGGDVIPVILPNYLVRDIDTYEDWETAELMHEVLKRKGYL